MDLRHALKPLESFWDFSDSPALFAHRRKADSGGETLLPAVEIREDDGHFTVTAELPGIKKEDISVRVAGGVLTLRAEKKTEEEKKTKKLHYTERSYGEYVRSFGLPDTVSEENIGAKFDKGVLTVTLNKREPAKPRETTIAVG